MPLQDFTLTFQIRLQSLHYGFRDRHIRNQGFIIGRWNMLFRHQFRRFIALPPRLGQARFRLLYLGADTVQFNTGHDRVQPQQSLPLRDTIAFIHQDLGDVTGQFRRNPGYAPGFHRTAQGDVIIDWRPDGLDDGHGYGFVLRHREWGIKKQQTAGDKKERMQFHASKFIS